MKPVCVPPPFRLLLAVLWSFTLAPSVAYAFQRDVHFDATFAIAIAVGFSWDDAGVIASATQGIDENLDTQPSISVIEAAKPDRNANRSLSELSLAIAGVEAHLPMQDYLFHCFSRNRDQRGLRNADVLERLEILQDKAERAIDAALRGSAANKTRALIDIGVYLHCMQDSWSHSGYGSEPFGHVKDRTDPDNPSKNPMMARNALHETAERLLGFWQRLRGIAKQELDSRTTESLATLLNGYTSVASTQLSDDSRVQCNRTIVEHWLFDAFKNGRVAKGGDLAVHVSHSERILRVSRPGRFNDSAVAKKRDPAPLSPIGGEPDPCDQVFIDVIPSALDKKNLVEDPHGCLAWSTWPCGVVHLSYVALPAPRYPLFKLAPVLEDVVKDEESGDYRTK
jgi:hypothetical protein